VRAASPRKGVALLKGAWSMRLAGAIGDRVVDTLAPGNAAPLHHDAR
jgi:hypothetical protein